VQPQPISDKIWGVANFDQDAPHPARMYDYYLDGLDNYEVDRAAAAQVEKAFPSVRRAAWANREFMHRSTAYLAQIGIRQFLDIGTGIPTEPNLHQVVQKIAPESHVVYVDNDPLVLSFARALMTSAPEGRTAYAEADVRRVDEILNMPALLRTLDLAQPVAISLIALLHFIPTGARPYDIVSALMDAVPSGSYLAISHATPDFAPETFAEITRIYNAGGMDAEFRSHAEVHRFFDGLELVEPGVVPPHRWHPDVEVPLRRRPGSDSPPVKADELDKLVSFYAGVAVKP
jgi:hypothetical protein